VRSIFGLPWTLQFDRDGFLDFTRICCTRGNRGDITLATSELFHYPEYHGDGIDPVHAAAQLMVSAPELLQALYILLAQLEKDANAGVTLTVAQMYARNTARSVIARALYPAKALECQDDEDLAGEYWLGGPPLPYDIAD
jgi:hypothetical protein